MTSKDVARALTGQFKEDQQATVVVFLETLHKACFGSVPIKFFVDVRNGVVLVRTGDKNE